MSESRQIRVYVCSPYPDMQAERDHLATVILPQLRELAEERGIAFEMVDMRYGAADEASAEIKVLTGFADEIKRCRPYFIGLLGEQYGRTPAAIPVDLAAREPWIAEQLSTGRSLVELEFLHGALRNVRLASGAYFYLRDPAYIESVPEADGSRFRSTDAADVQKLQDLKSAIRKSGLHTKENYANPTKLGLLVLTDFTRVIDNLISEGPRTVQLSPADLAKLLSEIDNKPADTKPEDSADEPAAVSKAEDKEAKQQIAEGAAAPAPVPAGISPSTPRIILTHLSGSRAGTVQEFYLSVQKEVWVGRDKASHVRYNESDGAVSREHLKIVQNFGDPNAYIIMSRGRNGTYINNVEVVVSSGVREGDIVQVGRGGPVFRFNQIPKSHERVLKPAGVAAEETIPAPPASEVKDEPEYVRGETVFVKFDPALAAAAAVKEEEPETPPDIESLFPQFKDEPGVIEIVEVHDQKKQTSYETTIIVVMVIILVVVLIWVFHK